MRLVSDMTETSSPRKSESLSRRPCYAEEDCAELTQFKIDNSFTSSGFVNLKESKADAVIFQLKFRLTPSFDCYSFESCCHDRRFFSLHRRPYPPFEWSSCFPRTIQLPLPASPCSRLSRPRSTNRQSDFRQAFGSSSLIQLVRPYKPGLSLTDLPCSHEILRLHASGTNPGSNSAHLP
jgi:hypothetical protein